MSASALNPESQSSDFIKALATATLQQAPTLRLPKSQWGVVTSFGYALTKLLGARTALRRHVEKHEGLASLRRFLPPNPPENASALSSSGYFCSLSAIAGADTTILEPIVDAHSCSLLAAKLGVELSGGTDAPVDANSPAWSALLRLRPLRDFWERELRRNHVELLTASLRDAWLLDPATLPPQAVIPRLDIATWSDLHRLHDSGRFFDIVPAWQNQPRWELRPASGAAIWRAGLEVAVSAAAATALVITERPSMAHAQTVIAFYRHSENRVELATAFALTPAGSAVVTVSPVEPA